jgi:hypothetical protein
MLLSILNMLEVFNLMLLIHIQPKMDNVYIDLAFQSVMLDLEVITFLKEIKFN